MSQNTQRCTDVVSLFFELWFHLSIAMRVSRASVCHGIVTQLFRTHCTESHGQEWAAAKQCFPREIPPYHLFAVFDFASTLGHEFTGWARVQWVSYYDRTETYV